MSSSEARLVDVVRARPKSGVTVWLIGNAGALVATRDAVIAIDPLTSAWLETRSDENPHPLQRSRPSRISSESLKSLADLVLITHEHPDHLDPGLAPVLASAGTPVVVPDGCVDVAVAHGHERNRVHGLKAGTTMRHGDVDVTAIAVPHAFASGDFGHYREWIDSEGRHHAVGYLIRTGGRTIFHGGDLVMRPGLDGDLKIHGVDTCLLPVNGRGWLREQQGLVGNLDARESVDLAAAVGAAVLIPIHYDGLVGNTASPGAVLDYADSTYPDLTVAVPGLGGIHLPALSDSA